MSPTLIEHFAERHRLRISTEPDGTTIIPGRVGFHLYEYSDAELALMLCGGPIHTGRWARVRSKCLAAGMTLRQNGEDEGALSFDPTNREQAARWRRWA